ncbi:hypothetical protein [Flavilitoribacter nigricans]|nr:hypothetical protein [Flavilitoribacter nigricans]
MKRLSLFGLPVFFLALFGGTAFGQKLPAEKTYKAWVTSGIEMEIHQGYLYELQENAIRLYAERGGMHPENPFIDVPFEDVELLQVQGKGGRLIGTLLGAAAGFVVGVAANAALWKGYDSKGRAIKDPAGNVRIGLILAIPGTFIGRAIGGKKTTIPLNSNKREALERYILTH